MPKPKVLGITTFRTRIGNSPVELHIGVLSVLFSYEIAIGYDYLDGVRILEDLNRHQQKHANQWRSYTRQIKVPELDLYTGLLTALAQESDQLSFKLLENLNART